MPRKTAQSYHHGDLKAALKQAALQLVREKGPKGFSLNEASRLAGVTAGAPYRHFADKEALLAELACEGNALLEREVREAAAAVRGTAEQMVEAGMAYLRFAATHSDYFAVIFNAGIDKGKYPEVQRSGMEGFGVILRLAGEFEDTPEKARSLAVSAWALVHGLAALRADGALVVAEGDLEQDLERLRPILWQFLGR